MDIVRTETCVIGDYNIVGGPSANRLLAHFQYLYDRDAKVPVKFSVAMDPCSSKTAYILVKLNNVMVTAIQHESGTGYNFNLSGYCEASLRPYPNGPVRVCNRFDAYYDAKLHRGSMRFF